MHGRKRFEEKAATVFLTLLPSAAFAHHAMDGETPSTFVEGMLSGLAHPVIGPDHLAGIAAVGVLAAAFARGQVLPLVFILAAAVGVLVHVAGVTLPFSEILLALSLLVLAALLWWMRAISIGLVAVLFAVFGLLHGYAYGESIVGAEPAPLLAYLAGLAAVQYLIAMICFTIARQLLNNHADALRFASSFVVATTSVLALFATTIG